MKPWYASKTIWINGLSAFAAFVGVITGVIDEHSAGYAVLVWVSSGINIWLRFLTYQPIEG